jgi:hypothetical protein
MYMHSLSFLGRQPISNNEHYIIRMQMPLRPNSRAVLVIISGTV